MNSKSDNKSDKKVLRKIIMRVVCGWLIVYRDAVSFEDDEQETTKVGGMRTPPVKRKRQSGRVCSEVKINSAGPRNKKGNMRMCGTKHNYNGHKADE